jgi:hypothetical protein
LATGRLKHVLEIVVPHQPHPHVLRRCVTEGRLLCSTTVPQRLPTDLIAAEEFRTLGVGIGLIPTAAP